MTYAVQQDMIDRFGEAEIIAITDRTGAGIIDATVLDQALADADDSINVYLVERYTLPLSTVPTVLVRLACDLARFNLYAEAPTEEVRNRRNDAITLLGQIAINKAGLGLDEPAPSGGLPQGTKTSSDRLITSDLLKDFSS